MALMPVCERLVHGLTCGHAGGLNLERAPGLRLDRALAVDRLTERVDDAAQQAVADADREDLTGLLDRAPLFDVARLAEDDRTDLVLLEVHRESDDAAGNSSISFAMHAGSPVTRAMPSPTSSTRPTSSRSSDGLKSVDVRAARRRCPPDLIVSRLCH